MVIILSGSDTFRSREKLRRIMLQYQQKFPAALGLVRLTGEEMNRVDPVEALRGNSLFRHKRLVVLERPHESSAEVQTRLAQSLGSQELIDSTDTIAVLWCAGALKKDSDFEKLAARRSVQAESFDSLEGPAVKRWVAKYVSERGAAIEPAAVAALVDTAGNDTWRLAAELEKLAAYCEGRPITAADVAVLVARPEMPQTFALADAVARRDRARALELLHQHLAAGDSPQALVGMIGYALRTLLLVVSAGPDQPTAVLAKTLELHPFVVTKARQQVSTRGAHGFTPPEIGQAVRLLADTDWYMKTGRIEPELALERFVVSVTRSG
ncbi:DNA polymerase III subunit delta [Candidatus Parcubacteria bacterium]|nr:DNA polymerase III subunit delta [Candidatus Parcubacteria bacterium]